MHQTVFVTHSQGEGITIDPLFILRMRIQRNEAAWIEIWFESTTQGLKSYRDWAI